MTKDPTTYPLHPLFADCKNQDPLLVPIEAIDVCRRRPDGRTPMLRWVHADELPDEMALLEQFGPGTYLLVGRDLSRTQILRKHMIDVGDVDEAPPPAPAASATPAASSAAGTLEIFRMMQEERRVEREREREDRRAEREREQAHSESLLKAITSFAGAQLESTRAMLGAKANPSPANNGLSGVREILEFTEQVQANALAQRDVLREQVAQEVKDTGSDVIETFATTFASGLANKMNGTPPGGASA